jgi:hypothetical protein
MRLATSLWLSAIILLVTATSVLAQASQWTNLVGGDLSQWTEESGDWEVVGVAKVSEKDNKLLATEEGTGVIVNGPTGRTVNLFSRMTHGDVQCHVEFMVPQGSNSGVYFQGRYEIQVLDSWGVKEPKHGDCGGIYQRWKDGQGYEGRPPKVNASKPPGQWQTFDVLFQAPRFDDTGKKIANARFVRVLHNGKLVHENAEVTGPTRAAAFSDEKPIGPLMLQGDHGPVAYRNIKVRPWKP